MPNEQENKLLDFIVHIPKSENPYLVVGKHLKELIEPPRLERWALIILYVILFAFVVLFFQSLNLWLYRIRLNALKAFTMSHLGLLFINVPVVSMFVFFFFSGLAVADLALQVMIEHGAEEMRFKIPLLCCKFLPVYGATWLYFWLCVCQLMATKWNEPWANSKSRTPSPGLPSWLRHISHALLVVSTTWIIPVFVICSLKADNEYSKIKRVVADILKSFIEPSSKYDPATFKTSELLLLLIPARKLVIYKDNMVDSFRALLMCAIGGLAFLGVVYIPMLAMSLRAIRERHDQCTFAEATSPEEISHKYANIQRRLREEQRTLWIHAGLVYFTTIAFLPPLILQVALPRKEFLKSRRWHTITQLGTHGPMAICGVCIMIILRSQSVRWIAALNLSQVNDETNTEGSDRVEMLLKNRNSKDEGNEKQGKCELSV